MALVTISQRKEREAGRRQAAVDRIMPALAGYAQIHGGHYLIFGSAASREMNYHSDFDVLVDFPIDAEHAAFSYLEDLCSDAKLPLDALSLRTMSSKFMNRNGAGMVVLP